MLHEIKSGKRKNIDTYIIKASQIQIMSLDMVRLTWIQVGGREADILLMTVGRQS